MVNTRRINHSLLLSSLIISSCFGAENLGMIGVGSCPVITRERFITYSRCNNRCVWEIDLILHIPREFILSLIADLLFGLMIALALFVRQPFCRICPILPMQTLFKKIGLLHLVKNGNSHCDTCSSCVKACPMDIYEIQDQAENKNITHSDCTLCGRCIEFCPHDGVMNFKYGPITLLSSSKEGFKKRTKIDKWWKG